MKTLIGIVIAIVASVSVAFVLGRSSTKAHAEYTMPQTTAQAAPAIAQQAQPKSVEPRIVGTLPRSEREAIKTIGKRVQDDVKAADDEINKRVLRFAEGLQVDEACYIPMLAAGPVSVKCGADGKLWVVTGDGGIAVYPPLAITWGQDGKMQAGQLPQAKIPVAP